MSWPWREEKQGEQDESRREPRERFEGKDTSNIREGKLKETGVANESTRRIQFLVLRNPKRPLSQNHPRDDRAGNLSNFRKIYSIPRSHIDNVLNTLAPSFRERHSHCFFSSLSLPRFFSCRYTSCWEKTRENGRKISRWLFSAALYSTLLQMDRARKGGRGEGEGESFSLWHRHCAMVRRTGFYSLVFSDEYPLKGLRGIEISILEYCSRVGFCSVRSRHLGDC